MNALKSVAHNVRVHRTVESIRALRKKIPSTTKVGFVPTMGALHEGHLSLMKEASMKNDVLVASVFVNPHQFGAGEDFDVYPRDLEKDLMLLSDLGVDHVFAPDIKTMYGENHCTFVDALGFDGTSEGVSRPGHFRGVATILTKLFNIVQPTNAYFGQKDAAQCVLIKRIVEDLNIPVNIEIIDTVREEDGLAMSSRNLNLTPIEREKASVIFSSLNEAKSIFDSFMGKNEKISSKQLKEHVEQMLLSEPLVSKIHYISVDDRETMLPLKDVGKSGAIVSVACKIGAVRLIDNIVLTWS